MQKIKLVNWIVTVLCVTIFTLPAQAAIFNTPCVDELTGQSNGCTAQDIAVQDIQIVWVGDGCTGPTDTAIVRMNIQLSTANPNRYDPGIYINTSGGNSAVTATGSQCLHEALYPLNNTTFNYTSGVGPFKDIDGDATGDMYGSETLTRSITQGDIGDANQSTLAEFQISCADNGDGLVGGLPNGFVDFAWAVSYAQNASAIIGTKILDTVPGAKSKCTSGISDTEGTTGSIAIGVPNLALSISCIPAPPQQVASGETVTCTVTYNNLAGIGPADNIEFHIAYPNTKGSIGTMTPPPSTTDTTTDNGTGEIRWVVGANQSGNPPTQNIPAGKVDTSMTFTFVSSYAGAVLNAPFTATAFFNNGTTSTIQPLSATDSVTLPVTLSYVYPKVSGSLLDIDFSTESETSNIGFNVYAVEGQKWTKLNDDLIPGALDSLEPKSYHANIDMPTDMEVKKIGIAGVDVNNNEDRHGPFKINKESGSKSVAMPPIDWKKTNKQVKADRKAKKAGRKATKVALKDQIISLAVSEDAVYRVTHDELLAAGVDLSDQKAENIAISLRGKGVARHLEGLSKKNQWTKGSFIEFTGTAPEGSDALYLSSNRYQLSLAKKLVVDSKGIEPITTKKIVFEENKQYSWTIPGKDPFYDAMFYTRGAGTPGSLTRKFTLPSVPKGELEFIVYVSAFSDEMHHLTVALNGTQVGEVQTTGWKEIPVNLTIDNTLILEGENVITITALGEGTTIDVFIYDKAVLSYDDGIAVQTKSPIVEMSDGLRKKLIEPKKGTNYVIISHPLFMGEALDGYIAQREGEGWKIQLVDVEDIYTAYGYGMATPDAIKAYLKDVERKGVTHVQLVGAASYDYHDYLGLGSVSFIPSMYVNTASIVQYTPCDGCMTADESGIPKLAIGRWPVRTLEDLEAVINKTLAWEQSGQSRAHSALLIADPEENGINFSKQMDSIANQLEKTGEWNDITRVYLDNLIAEQNGNINAAVLAARKQITQSLSDGASITSFSGHSAPTMWSFNRLLKQDDIASINNINQTTIALPLACYTTYADSPSINTLAHQFLAAGENGAVAVYGAATLSQFSQNGAAITRVIDNLLAGETLGESIRKAKEDLGLGYSDIIRNSNLLGDVTLKLK